MERIVKIVKHASLMKIGYEITQGRKVEKPKASELYIYWKDFFIKGKNYSGTKIEEVGLRNYLEILMVLLKIYPCASFLIQQNLMP